MRVGILGIGAIGSVIAHCLELHHDVYYFNRSTKSKIVVKKNNDVLIRKIELSLVDKVPTLDWLIICLKEFHYSDAHDTLQSLITTDTKVAVIRNGINLEEPILRYTDSKNIVECIIDCPTQVLNDGMYHQLYDPIIKVSNGKLSSEFRGLFRLDRLGIVEVEDYHTESWKKLIESSAIGSILCLTGETCRIFENSELVNLYGLIIDEAILVAKADNANISLEFKSELVQKLIAYPPDKGSSMLTDRIRGSLIEVNAKNGIISQVAKKHNIRTELNDTLSLLLRCINMR